VSKLLKRASSSLLGNVVLVEVLFSAPLCLIFLSQSYAEKTLTVSWTAWLIVVWAAMGAAAAVVFWYAVSLPLIKSRGK
jgi:hypothetical protein